MTSVKRKRNGGHGRGHDNATKARLPRSGSKTRHGFRVDAATRRPVADTQALSSIPGSGDLRAALHSPYGGLVSTLPGSSHPNNNFLSTIAPNHRNPSTSPIADFPRLVTRVAVDTETIRRLQSVSILISRSPQQRPLNKDIRFLKAACIRLRGLGARRAGSLPIHREVKEGGYCSSPQEA